MRRWRALEQQRQRDIEAVAGALRQDDHVRVQVDVFRRQWSDQFYRQFEKQRLLDLAERLESIHATDNNAINDIGDDHEIHPSPPPPPPPPPFIDAEQWARFSFSTRRAVAADAQRRHRCTIDCAPANNIIKLDDALSLYACRLSPYVHRCVPVDVCPFRITMSGKISCCMSGRDIDTVMNHGWTAAENDDDDALAADGDADAEEDDDADVEERATGHGEKEGGGIEDDDNMPDPLLMTLHPPPPSDRSGPDVADDDDDSEQHPGAEAARSSSSDAAALTQRMLQRTEEILESNNLIVSSRAMDTRFQRIRMFERIAEAQEHQIPSEMSWAASSAAVLDTPNSSSSLTAARKDMDNENNNKHTAWISMHEEEVIGEHGRKRAKKSFLKKGDALEPSSSSSAPAVVVAARPAVDEIFWIMRLDTVPHSTTFLRRDCEQIIRDLLLNSRQREILNRATLQQMEREVTSELGRYFKQHLSERRMPWRPELEAIMAKHQARRQPLPLLTATPTLVERLYLVCLEIWHFLECHRAAPTASTGAMAAASSPPQQPHHQVFYVRQHTLGVLYIMQQGLALVRGDSAGAAAAERIVILPSVPLMRRYLPEQLHLKKIEIMLSSLQKTRPSYSQDVTTGRNFITNCMRKELETRPERLRAWTMRMQALYYSQDPFL
jgi:hypothetical protein